MTGIILLQSFSKTMPLIFAAVTAFCLVRLSAEGLSPLLQRMRFLSAGETDNGRETPTGAGIAAAIAAMISSFISCAFRGDAPDSMKMLISGQIIILLGVCCGFYSDLLQSKGKKGGMSRKAELLSLALLCACYTVLTYIDVSRETVMLIPFLGEKDLGTAFCPLTFAACFAASAALSAEGDSRPGESMSALFFMGTASVTGGSGFDICSCAAAGSAAAFFFMNFPKPRMLWGKSGVFFAAVSAAVITGYSGRTVIYALIMLIPFFFKGIKNFIRKISGKSLLYKYDKIGETKIYCIFSAVCIILSHGLMTYNSLNSML